MRNQIILYLTIGALTSLPLPAFAQFGFGFGAGNWGGWGNHFGSWFGVSVWPYYRPSSSLPRRAESPRQQGNGTVEGLVTVQPMCPVSQSGTACPLLPNALNSVTVTAQPSGGAQWVTAQADSQGRYRLILPPGSYTVTAHHPDAATAQNTAHIIVIQSGQTQQQDFHLMLPVQ